MANFLTAGEVAWYGAIVATLTLAFNVWKWTFERARLRVRIMPTFYQDGGFEKVGELRAPILYYHVEVTNVGERPTTIMGVSATTQPKGLVDYIRRAQCQRRAASKGV